MKNENDLFWLSIQIIDVTSFLREMKSLINTVTGVNFCHNVRECICFSHCHKAFSRMGVFTDIRVIRVGVKSWWHLLSTTEQNVNIFLQTFSFICCTCIKMAFAQVDDAVNSQYKFLLFCYFCFSYLTFFKESSF